MNRREMLTVLGVGGLTAVNLAAERADVAADPYLELRIAAKPGELPFTVEEFATAGKSVGAVRCDDERGLMLFLGRTAKDPAGAKQLRLIVADGSTLERVWAAVRACRISNFAQVRYHGCIPPGCGIPTGATPTQIRHAGTVYTSEALDGILSANSIKC